MARIPEDQIEQIKSNVSLLRLAESQGYQPVKHGKDFAVCCPFHDDKTPSCIISPKSNLFNCFGCGAGGSVIDWVMKTKGIGFRYAVEILKSDPSSLAADSGLKARPSVPMLENPLNEGENDQAVLHRVINYYHETLKQAPEALDYLKARGLDDPELINDFKLGYANRTLGLRLPQKNRQEGASLREQLKRIGLYRDTGREHFNGSIVIPIVNSQNEITEVYGRKTRDDLRKGTPKHTYLPGPHYGVFNWQGLENTEEIILCESLIDALTFWRWGFKHVTTSFGTNGFTEEILEALAAKKIKRVLIAYDRDEAGNNAALELAENLKKHGIDCFRVLFPKGMDANEYACQMNPPQKALAIVLRKAEFMSKGEAPELTTVVEQNTVAPSSLVATLAAENREDELEDAEENLPQVTEEERMVDAKASPMPSVPQDDMEVSQGENELFITLGARVYRVRGLNTANIEQLKIQLLVKQDDLFHMDKLDLYSSKQRQVFINQACMELGVKDDVIKKDLGKVLLKLEDILEKNSKEPEEKTTTLEPIERKAALALLKDPNLINRILEDFNTAGVIGEETNKLVGYLACTSRKLAKPLAVMIQSTSAAGKSSLMDAVLNFMPEEERTQYSAMTGQSLFYMGETNLKHKILAVSEEEGASNASYALKLLQSEGEVTIASTVKDENSGNLTTKEYRVEGPIMLFFTTTAIDNDEELVNRCLVLSVNEEYGQTEAIHAIQRNRRTLEGYTKQQQKQALKKLHQNAQRLLKPCVVINPYADELTFISHKTRTRRDNEKYLTLIDSIALLHQYQRELKTVNCNGEIIEYIEVTLEDIALANALAGEVLGRTLDELPAQTRKLLNLIHAHVDEVCQQENIARKDYRFSRRLVREISGWSETQTRVHMQRLVGMEYLLTHRGGRGQSFEYELLYNNEGDQGAAFLMGLVDVETLRQVGKTKGNETGDKAEENAEEKTENKIANKLKNDTTTQTSRGELGEFAALSRPQRGTFAAQEKSSQPLNGKDYSESSRNESEKAY